MSNRFANPVGAITYKSISNSSNRNTLDAYIISALNSLDDEVIATDKLTAGTMYVGRPLWSTTSNVVVPFFTVKDSSYNTLTNSNSLTPSLATEGAVLGIMQSGNLAGTISVSSGAASVTGVSTTFSSSFIVGDVITTAGGQKRRIISIASNTSLTVESNWSSTESTVLYKRGGKAPSTWYHLYAISDGTSNTLAWNTRSYKNSETPNSSDFPGSYTLFRQLPLAVRTDGSGNILEFDTVLMGGSLWQLALRSTADLTAKSGFTSTSFTAVDLLATSGANQQIVPKNCNSTEFYCVNSGAAPGVLFGRPTGSSSAGRELTAENGYAGYSFIAPNSSGSIDIKSSTASATWALYLSRFTLDAA